MGIMSRLTQILYGENINPLPKAIVITMVILNMLSAMTVTMVFDYLPKMVKNFGISEVDTGTFAGYIASSYHLGRAIFSLIWGRLAEGKRRKTILAINLVANIMLPLVFGLSRHFSWAVISRLTQGFFCGIPLIMKLIIWDICDETNVTLCLSMVMSAFPIGLIIGPGLAGFLVFPHELYPSVFTQGTFFDYYPVFLPNLVLAIGFLISAIFFILFIPSKERSRKISNDSENKSLLSEEITETNSYQASPFKIVTSQEMNGFNGTNTYGALRNTSNGAEVQLSSEENKPSCIKAVPPCETITNQKKTGFRRTKLYGVLSSTNCVMCCIMYASHSFTVIGYEEILPVWAATSKEFHGLDFNPSQIGLMLLIAGAFMVLFQFTIQARIASNFGIIESYVASSSLNAVVLLLTPLSHSISNEQLKYLFLYACQIIAQLTIGTSFLCLIYLLNNSVFGSLRGTANGLSMAFGSVAMYVRSIVISKCSLVKYDNQYYRPFQVTHTMLLSHITFSYIRTIRKYISPAFLCGSVYGPTAIHISGRWHLQSLVDCSRGHLLIYLAIQNTKTLLASLLISTLFFTSSH